MALLIENSGSTIKVTLPDNTIINVPKQGLKLKTNGEYLTFIEHSRETLSFKFDTVTTPVVASASALATIVNSYLIQDGNQEQTAFVSAARTATSNSADIDTGKSKGVIVVVDVTAVTAIENVTVKIQGKDSLSGKYYDILVSSAISSISTVVLKVFPAATPVANTTANDHVPKMIRVRVEHSAAGSFTYSVNSILLT